MPDRLGKAEVFVKFFFGAVENELLRRQFVLGQGVVVVKAKNLTRLQVYLIVDVD